MCVSVCVCVFAVSRYVCRSELYECDLILDVNIDVYPMEVSHAM